MTSMSSMHHPRLSDLGAMAADRIPLERANEGSDRDAGGTGFFLLFAKAEGFSTAVDPSEVEARLVGV